MSTTQIDDPPGVRTAWPDLDDDTLDQQCNRLTNQRGKASHLRVRETALERLEQMFVRAEAELQKHLQEFRYTAFTRDELPLPHALVAAWNLARDPMLHAELREIVGNPAPPGETEPCVYWTRKQYSAERARLQDELDTRRAELASRRAARMRLAEEEGR